MKNGNGFFAIIYIGYLFTPLPLPLPSYMRRKLFIEIMFGIIIAYLLMFIGGFIFIKVMGKLTDWLMENCPIIGFIILIGIFAGGIYGIVEFISHTFS